jgi:hypothetical protein
MNSAVTDWYSAQRRAEAELAKAMRRRDDADYKVKQVEEELERIKAAVRKEEVR